MRREAASAAAATTRTVSTARAELAQVRSDLSRQRVVLDSHAAVSGRRRVRLVASQPELDAAAERTAGDPAMVLSALRDCQELLRVADTHLAGSRAGWWRRSR
jgi:hypothetical protein